MKRIQKIEATLPELKKKKRVAAYARVSVAKGRTLNSLSQQVSYYNNLITNNKDWEFAGVYSDLGVSGASANRKGFQEMLNACEEGNIDLILTKSISKFGRNTVDLLEIVRHLKSLGVEVHFEKENIWTFDSKGELLITIMSSLAQEESRSISENVTWGHRKRFSDGKVSIPFGNFLGYDKGPDGNLVVNKEQAKIVKKIYKYFLEGNTPYRIAKMLTAEGIPTIQGKKTWSAGPVKNILTNEKYKGDALLQKSFTVNFLTKEKKINEGEIPQYYVEKTTNL